MMLFLTHHYLDFLMLRETHTVNTYFAHFFLYCRSMPSGLHRKWKLKKIDGNYCRVSERDLKKFMNETLSNFQDF